MSNHTPRPWKVHSATGQISTMVDIESSRVVANMRATCVNERWEADAALIAAAPDLLEVMKKLHDHGFTTRGDLDMVREVIRKADPDWSHES